jgi:hypothetical protein
VEDFWDKHQVEGQKGRITMEKGMKPHLSSRVIKLKGIKDTKAVIKAVEVDTKEVRGTKETTRYRLDHESRWTGTVTRGC